jgi:hypothetical protein
MRGDLVEVAHSFKALVPCRPSLLTYENITGTFVRLEGGLNVMTAVLGTLPFLATLWLLVVLGAKALEESGDKIVAALRGEPVQRTILKAGRPRHRSRRQKPTGARASLRAAA